MSELKKFIDHIDAAPRILLLGQRFFGVDDNQNPLFGMPELIGIDNAYDELIGNNSSILQRKLDELGSTITLNPELDCFRRFPWRCVFSSAIDPTIFRLFNDDKRRPVTSAFAQRELDSASLTLFRLFGATGRKSSEEIPPSSRRELSNRRTANTDLLNLLEFTFVAGIQAKPTGCAHVILQPF
jgi:hypothetical protein